MIPRTIDDQSEQIVWDSLDAVVFDVGNVLVRFDPEALLRLWVPDHPELYPVLMQKVFRSPYWPMLDHGVLSTDEAIIAMTGRDTELLSPITALMHGWPDLRDTIPEGIRAVHACKAHGKRLYILSNYHHESFPVIWRKYDFFRMFDGKIISGEVGLLKPDPDIYRLLTSTFRLQPERTLFIDDTPANIEGALYVGWQGICFNSPGKLDRFFRA